MNRKQIITGVSLLLVPLIAYGVYELAMHLRFSPTPPAADFTAPASRTEARQQDLIYFENFLELDRSYTPQTRAVARGMLDELAEQLEFLSDAQFQLGITRAVAAADNGHTNIWIGRFSRQHGRLPIRFHWFDDGLYVVAAQAPYTHLLGQRLERVGGTDIQAATQRLKVFVGGPWSGYRAYRGPVILELPSALHAVGLSDSDETATLEFAGANAPVVMEKVALTEDEPLWWSHSYLAPAEPLENWSVLQPPLPLFLQEPEQLFRSRYMEDADLLYVQFRANQGEGLDVLQAQVRRQLATHRPATLVIDQRLNGGGDYTLTQKLMTDLPAIIDMTTRVYVITGNATFSAGINSVAFARAALGERMTIIGQRIGDDERAYGETNNFELPNSRLGITFSTGLHDVADGCPPFPECYWRNYFNDVAVGSLDPDISVDYNFDDFAVGVDPVMGWILDDRGSRDQ
jgi:hypothetical protein